MINSAFRILSIIFIFAFLLHLYELHAKDKNDVFRIMEYNVENLFDCYHDSLKQDTEFSPQGLYHWTPTKYRKKLFAVARGIILGATRNADFYAPDIIGLCEVENESVVNALCFHSPLSGAGYDYLVTDSPDMRGIDVAFLYRPDNFRIVSTYSLRVPTIEGMRPTRDILYAKGETLIGMLHAFMVHAPSRRGGAATTRSFRMSTVKRLMSSIDSIRTNDPDAQIIVMGDFNAYHGDESIEYILSNGMTDLTNSPYITHNDTIKGTYRFRGQWGSLDHVFVSQSLLSHFLSSSIADHPELLEEDEKYGGLTPRRFFQGIKATDGYSDHLPLRIEFK